MNWVCFNDRYPKEMIGVIIKIDAECDKYASYEFDPNKTLFWGYVMQNSDYIYITQDITNQCGMGWKVLKEYSKNNIYWHEDLNLFISSIEP